MNLGITTACALFSIVLFGCSNISENTANSVKTPFSQKNEKNNVHNHSSEKQPTEKSSPSQRPNKQEVTEESKDKNSSQIPQKTALLSKDNPTIQNQPKNKEPVSPLEHNTAQKEPKNQALEKITPPESEKKDNRNKKLDPIEETTKFEPQTFPDFYAPEKFGHPLQHSKKLTFMIGEDSKGSYLYGEGPIIEGAYDKFLKYVNHYKKLGINLDRLMLHSPGGVLNEGILIGEYILKNQWNTDADKYMRCYSTCGFIYAAGTNKRIQSGAEVGFHRPYLPNKVDTPEFIEQVYKEYQNYWEAVSGSSALYNKFMREYGRDDMYILNNRNIQKYMIVEKY
ncbi:hypothetical protein ACH7WW_000897 [Vibrio vulnificus]|uniref:hypothetical protein n=1 Tax=Vibrio vulnificus TaxID=672 RepID=UPI000925CCE9|nr:hypothetical protein [Vibrio vulnificus]EJV9310918.1 hypothetical protein [Vibrio vulnificus]OJI40455.1 hypothetical protein VVDAL7940_00603 [Vibrio vulnificus]